MDVQEMKARHTLLKEYAYTKGDIDLDIPNPIAYNVRLDFAKKILDSFPYHLFTTERTNHHTPAQNRDQ